jgi:hypothetical protein
MPITDWTHYADHQLDPLRRSLTLNRNYVRVDPHSVALELVSNCRKPGASKTAQGVHWRRTFATLKGGLDLADC